MPKINMMKGFGAIELGLLITIIALAGLSAFLYYEVQQQKALWEQYQQQLKCQGFGVLGCWWDGLLGVLGQHKEVASIGVGTGLFAGCAGAVFSSIVATVGSGGVLAPSLAIIPTVCGIVGVGAGVVTYGALGGTVGSVLVSVFGGFGTPIIAGLAMGLALSVWLGTVTKGATGKVPYLTLLIFVVGFAIGAYIGQEIINYLPYIAGITVIGLVVYFYVYYVRKT